jgi:tight adherence protein B
VSAFVENERVYELLEGYREKVPAPVRKDCRNPDKRRIFGRSFRQAETFERDYTALLLSLASSVRTGKDPLTALTQSTDLFPVESPLHAELGRFRAALGEGATEENAIRSFAAGIPHPDIELFRSALIVSRREGSSLGECLHRLVRFTRQRQSFRRKMRAAVAMQRLSSMGIACCAAVIALMQYLANRRGFAEALAHPLGRKALIAGAMLMTAGFSWMALLTRRRL